MSWHCPCLPSASLCRAGDRRVVNLAGVICGAKYVMLCFLLVIVPLATSAAIVVLDGDDWVVENANGSIRIGARVPGNIFVDLERAGVIGDPRWRFNERDYKWIAQEPSWLFTRHFASDATDATIVFEGVDTIADIIVNGAKIGRVDNMFRRFAFAVALRGAGDVNTLQVRIESAVKYAESQSMAYPYILPSSDWPAFTIPHRNMVRKAQCDFGWDWGPAFAACGIWRSVQLVVREANAILVAFKPGRQVHYGNGSVDVFLSASVATAKALSFAVRATFGGDTEVVRMKVSSRGRFNVELNFHIENARLWWPAGIGAPYLYEASCELLGDSSLQLHKRVGLRHVEVVRDPIAGGETFFFRINGVDVFAKGANLIPLDSFHANVSDASVLTLLDNALVANMNMIRVWGGGIYQSDALYDGADERGLMIWQEVMFACATYPRDDHFLANVRIEVEEQMTRIGEHASVVIIGGNNENEVGMGWYAETLDNPLMYIVDYAKLYIDTVREAVLAAAPNAYFIVSSPTNGPLSQSPFVLRWGDANDNTMGDVHYYDYQNDCADPTHVPDARFVSEFGFQSLPSMFAWKEISDESDWEWDSPLMRYRQRHEDGNHQLLSQIGRQFRIPEQFSALVYLSQAVQSVCYRTAIEKWRRSRTSFRTMGVLYWQLNSIWQAPTWSSLEYGTQRWKMLHYEIRHLFAPLLVSPVESSVGVVDVYAVSDASAPLMAVLCVQLFMWSGVKPFAERCTEVTVKGASSTNLGSVILSELIPNGFNRTDVFVYVTLVDHFRRSQLAANYLLLDKLKNVELVDPRISIRCITRPSPRHSIVSFSAMHVAPFTFFETPTAGHFSDNAIFVLPGDHTIEFVTPENDTLLDPTSLRITSLFDTVAVVISPDTVSIVM